MDNGFFCPVLWTLPLCIFLNIVSIHTLHSDEWGVILMKQCCKGNANETWTFETILVKFALLAVNKRDILKTSSATSLVPCIWKSLNALFILNHNQLLIVQSHGNQFYPLKENTLHTKQISTVCSKPHLKINFLFWGPWGFQTCKTLNWNTHTISFILQHGTKLLAWDHRKTVLTLSKQKKESTSFKTQ